MSDIKERKARRLLDKVEFYYAQREASMISVDEEEKRTFECKYRALRDAASQRSGKISPAETVAIKRGLRPHME